MSSPQKQGIDRSSKWLQRAMLLAIILACAVAVSPNLADPDLWGHVRYGRDVLASGEIAPTTTYSFTAAGYRWINHENLAELLLAIGANTIGPIGLLVAKCLLGVAVILLIAAFARRQGAGLITVGCVALLVAVNLAYHWSVRPQVLTYFYFALMIALLAWSFRGWEGQWQLPWRRGSQPEQPTSLKPSLEHLRFLWLAPILFLFWANTHGGFVAGYCIFFRHNLVCRLIEVLVCRGRAGFGMARRLTLMIVVAGLATLVNPYGPGLHLWLISVL